MVGRNQLILCPDEMRRALNMYFCDMIWDTRRGATRVVSVRQKTAEMDMPFIVELSSYIPDQQAGRYIVNVPAKPVKTGKGKAEQSCSK